MTKEPFPDLSTSLIDVLVGDLMRRTMIVGVLAKQVPPKKKLMTALKELRQVGANLSAASALQDSTTPEMVLACKRVADTLSSVEAQIWAGLHREMIRAEGREPAVAVYDDSGND